MNEETTPIIFASSLESAKEGETVMLCYGGWSSHREPRVITRTTKTVIFIGGRSFNRKGREKGAHRPDWIKLTDYSGIQELLNAKEQSDLVHRFKNSEGWETFTLDQLRQVSALCLSFKPTP